MVDLLKLFKKSDTQEAIGLLPFRERRIINYTVRRKVTQQKQVFKPDYSYNFFLM